MELKIALLEMDDNLWRWQVADEFHRVVAGGTSESIADASAIANASKKMFLNDSKSVIESVRSECIDTAEIAAIIRASDVIKEIFIRISVRDETNELDAVFARYNGEGLKCVDSF